MSPNYKNIT